MKEVAPEVVGPINAASHQANVPAPFFFGRKEEISRNDTVLVKYAYLADGMKARALNDGGAGLVYRGSLVFRRDSLGTLSFESAPIAAGRMTANGVRYHVTDHLGSVRGVVDGATGALYEASRYGAYGHRSEETNLPFGVSVSTPPAGEASFRYHYTGQEDQGADFGLPYTDFGARHYSPVLRRWLVPDPLSEKYYDVSPYAYCAGDPVNMVDVDGKIPWLVGALVGGGTDFISQTVVNLTRGYDFVQSIRAVDYTSVGASIVCGAVSPTSTIRKVAMAVLIVSDAIVDYTIDDGWSIVGNNEGDKSGREMIIDGVSSALGNDFGNAISHRIIKGLEAEASNKATATLTKSMKQQKLVLYQKAKSPLGESSQKAVINNSFSLGKEVIKQATEDNHRPLVLQIEQGDLLEEEPLFKYYYFNSY